MVSHRAAIRAAAVVTKIRQNRASTPTSSVPSRRTTPTETPNPSTWVNPYPRESRYTAAAAPSDAPPLNLPKPPFVEVLDPSVFSHPSLAGDLKVFRFERPEGVQKKWDRRVESFEKLEHFGKSLLRMTLTELVTNHYASLTVPAVESLVTKLLSDDHILNLSDFYGLSSRLLADPLADKYLRLSSSVKISLFYAYAAGIYHQEGVSYASQWIRQCFRNGLDEEYKSMKKEIFAKQVAEAEAANSPPSPAESVTPHQPSTTIARPVRADEQGQAKEKEKPRNQNPVIPEVMPLVQLDAWVKRHKLPSPEWSYAVKGVAPDEVFRADLKIGEKTVQGSGKTKNWARQSAAAAYLGIKDLDPRLLECALLPLDATNYTGRLHEFAREIELPRPQYSTVVNPKSPHYKCTLQIGSKSFIAEALGKPAVRREASKLALDYFNPPHELETELLNYVRSHQYSITFLHSQDIDLDASSDKSQKSEDPWTCKIHIRGDGEKVGEREEIAEIVGKGMNKIIARGEAVTRAAKMFGIDQGRKQDEEQDTQLAQLSEEQQSHQSPVGFRDASNSTEAPTNYSSSIYTPRTGQFVDVPINQQSRREEKVLLQVPLTPSSRYLQEYISFGPRTVPSTASKALEALEEEEDKEEKGEKGLKERAMVWLTAKGPQWIWTIVWISIQLLVFALGVTKYLFKTRSIFGSTFVIARSAALVLHVDVAFILFPVCRGFVSTLRRCSLNEFVPFEKNVEFHKMVAWSIVFWTLVHTVAHLVNFWLLASLLSPSSSIPLRILSYVEANLTTGPGVTGWLMILFLGVMCYFALDRKRKKNFQRFQWSHLLFIPFFACWQLHGVRCSSSLWISIVVQQEHQQKFRLG
ncbi:hypothetical protein JCM5350_001028 [Sporobolomyces pararoseus]